MYVTNLLLGVRFAFGSGCRIHRVAGETGKEYFTCQAYIVVNTDCAANRQGVLPADIDVVSDNELRCLLSPGPTAIRRDTGKATVFAERDIERPDDLWHAAIQL